MIHKLPTGKNEHRATMDVLVECNRTKFRFRSSLRERKRKDDFLMFYLSSTGSLRGNKPEGCYAYIPFENVDVTALMKPCEVGVWCLILATAAVLAAVWSLMLRESSLEIFAQISPSFITVRDMEFRRKSLANTTIGCAVLCICLFRVELVFKLRDVVVLETYSKNSEWAKVDLL